MDELLSLSTVMGLLNVTGQTVRNMVKDGRLEAVYPQKGAMGRPKMMITASSYGKYLMRKDGVKL